jgi:uncharacterized protein (TIGR04222 family)
MELLADNFIANMRGPDFLILYFVTILAAFVIGRNIIRNADTSIREQPRQLPSRPDALELAYLRGGVPEVIRLTIFKLVQAGRLVLANARTGKIARAVGFTDSAKLSGMESIVYKELEKKRTVRDLCKRLFSRFVKDCGPLETRLKERRLLTEQAVVDSARRVRMTLLVLILGLGGYKLAVALSKGRTNVLFLIILAAAGCILTLWKCRAPRLSRLGEDYLKRLRTEREDEKNAIGTGSEISGAEIGGADLTFYVALFGFGMLAGTPYSGFTDVLASPVSSSGDSSGGCGGGAGGCSGGGSSDGGGGGCGGCGGGD